MQETTSLLQCVTRTRTRYSPWNFLSGVILSIGAGENCRYQILTRDGAVITAKKPANEAYDLKVGQPAIVKISTDEVCVSPKGAAALPEWNQWSARIVLVEPGTYGRRVTAKIIGEPWTLMSTTVMKEIDREIKTWDVVTLFIDPAQVFLIGGGGKKSPLRRRLLTYMNQSLLPNTLFTYR